jgi:hypothetical protein
MFVLIHGKAGCGKTMLCQAIMRVVRPAIYVDHEPDSSTHDALLEYLHTNQRTLLTVIDSDDVWARDKKDLILDPEAMLDEPRRLLVVTIPAGKIGGVPQSQARRANRADLIIEVEHARGGGSARVKKNRSGTCGTVGNFQDTANTVAKAFVGSLGLLKAVQEA